MRRVCIVVITEFWDYKQQLLYLCNLQEGSKCFILFILAELRRVKSAKMLSMSKLYSEEDNSQDLENIE